MELNRYLEVLFKKENLKDPLLLKKVNLKKEKDLNLNLKEKEWEQDYLWKNLKNLKKEKDLNLKEKEENLKRENDSFR